MTTPNPPPEGQAIEAARTRARLSIREAARRAEMSEGRWRQIVRGYHLAAGVVVPDYGPDDTIARMAHAVGLTPTDLTKAGRPDAAAILRTFSHAEEPPALFEAPTTDLTHATDDQLLEELGRRLRRTHGNPTATRPDLMWGLAARRGETDD
jgi:transcriptional regulator with XRE-family HTH domain